MNCRSVSPKTWEHARQALVFYFIRRHGLPNAEDLAHETLAAVLSREDYQFEKEEDFLKVCYGFASHILQKTRRETGKFPNTLIDPNAASATADTHGLKETEINVYLNEIFSLGELELSKTDWELIQQAILLDGDRLASDPAEANRTRVKLHRARKKLGQLAGWRRG
jgi:hypothetical protein